MEEDEIEEDSPLAFLEKSHCIPIILALSKNGLMNRNQLYQELGQTINIVIKRIDLLIKKEIIYEFKVPVKPFAKYLVLTEKGHGVAKYLKEIEGVTRYHGTGKIKRINFSIDEVSNIVLPPNLPEFRKEVIKRLKDEAQTINCRKCNGITYLAKEINKFYWICVHCGNKEKADLDETSVVAVAENY